jgi:hemoglobin
MENAKRDIAKREDLVVMLDAFYAKVRKDPLIGPVFNEVAQVNWETHLPKIYNFWDSLLFGADNYKGRPFPPHVSLGVDVDHFERWLRQFIETVDEHHAGLKADEIKSRAVNIGRNFLANLRALREAGKL